MDEQKRLTWEEIDALTKDQVLQEINARRVTLSSVEDLKELKKVLFFGL